MIEAGKEKWIKAQEHELAYWARFLRDELGFNRDQLVGFRHYEGLFHLLHAGMPWYNYQYTRKDAYIQGKLLDVGCGPISVFEKARGVETVAIDPLLKRMAEEMPDLVQLGTVNNCEYRSCAIQDVKEQGFDVVWCVNVLDHADDWQGIVRHFDRVLKPGGKLIIGVDVRRAGNLGDECHISCFTAQDLLDTLSRFTIEWHSPITEEEWHYRFTLRGAK